MKWDMLLPSLGFLLQWAWTCVLALLSWRLVASSSQEREEEKEPVTVPVESVESAAESAAAAEPAPESAAAAEPELAAEPPADPEPAPVPTPEPEPAASSEKDEFDMEEMIELVTKLLVDQQTEEEQPEVADAVSALKRVLSDHVLSGSGSGGIREMLGAAIAPALASVQDWATCVELLLLFGQTAKVARLDVVMSADVRLFLDHCGCVYEGESNPSVQELMKSCLVSLLPASVGLIERIIGSGDMDEVVSVLNCLCHVSPSQWSHVNSLVLKIIDYLTSGGVQSQRLSPSQLNSVLASLVQLFPARAEHETAPRKSVQLRFPTDLVRAVLKQISDCLAIQGLSAEISANLLTSLAYLGVSSGDHQTQTSVGSVAHQLLVHAVRSLSQVQTDAEQTVHLGAKLLYAAGRLRVKAPDAISDLTGVLRSRSVGVTGRLLKTQELANMIYGLALLRGGGGGLVSVLSEWVAERASEMKPQELSISVYSMSQLEVGATLTAGSSLERMLTRVGEEVERRWSSCSAQAISNTIYGMARLNYRSERLLGVVGREMGRRLDEFTPQHISNVMYALGRLGMRDERMLTEICEYVIKSGRIHQFRPQNISNTIYACWKLQFTHISLFQLVADHLPSRFHECVPQDISNVVFAFGELNFKDAVFFAAVKKWTQQHARAMSARDKSFLISALKRANISPS